MLSTRSWSANYLLQLIKRPKRKTKLYGESQYGEESKAELQTLIHLMTRLTNNPSVPCPDCGLFCNRVICTRREDTGVIIRRRHCIECDHRWYTMQYPEVATKDYPKKRGRKSNKKVSVYSKVSPVPSLGIQFGS